MKQSHKILLATALSLASTSVFALPNITVLATGGTIAGGGESVSYTHLTLPTICSV